MSVVGMQNLIICGELVDPEELIGTSTQSFRRCVLLFGLILLWSGFHGGHLVGTVQVQLLLRVPRPWWTAGEREFQVLHSMGSFEVIKHSTKQTT